MSTPPVTTPPTTGTTNGLPSGQSLNNMFLQLLVAQLQNQDPTSPVDPSQFVGQLAQFSELSEVTSIYTLLQGIVPATGTSGPNAGTPTTNSGTSSGGAVSAVLGASSLAPPSAGAPPSLKATSVASVTQPNFASPDLSALTNKIQGVF